MKHAMEVIDSIYVVALTAIVSLSIAARIAVWCYRWVENAWREDKDNFRDREKKNRSEKPA